MSDLFKVMWDAMVGVYPPERAERMRNTRALYKVALRRALDAAEAQGWVLVPKEPTHDMMVWADLHASELTVRSIWDTMLARAPKP